MAVCGCNGGPVVFISHFIRHILCFGCRCSCTFEKNCTTGAYAGGYLTTRVEFSEIVRQTLQLCERRYFRKNLNNDEDLVRPVTLLCVFKYNAPFPAFLPILYSRHADIK